jgi:hypothetical protein
VFSYSFVQSFILYMYDDPFGRARRRIGSVKGASGDCVAARAVAGVPAVVGVQVISYIFCVLCCNSSNPSFQTRQPLIFRRRNKKNPRRKRPSGSVRLYVLPTTALSRITVPLLLG